MKVLLQTSPSGSAKWVAPRLIRKSFVLFMGALFATDTAGQSPGRVIRINPEVEQNLSAPDDIAHLKDLTDGVDEALYLVTTDLRTEVDGTWKSVWGWPSFFTNPHAGRMVPKAPYHVFQMIHRMAPNRIEATRAGGTVGSIASKDASGRITVLVWNHSHTIPEFGLGVETGQREAITCRVVNADSFFKTTKVHMRRALVSQTVSNARYLFERGEPLDERAELQIVDEGEFSVIDGILSVGFAQPPSSVSFVELTPVETPNEKSNSI